MKKVTEFWQRYVAGQLCNLSDFKRAVQKERTASDNDTFVERFTDQYKPGEMWEAPSRIALPSIMSTEQTLRLHDRADWQQTNEAIQLFAARYVEACRKLGIPMYVHCAFRTPEEQTALVAKGRSRAKPPRAPHVQGQAVDIVHARYHWDMSTSEWAFLGRLGKDIARRSGLDVTWGGDWSFYDPAHWEITNWRENVTQRHTGAPVRYTPRKLLRLLK